ncbi:MAG: VOC family protein [Candidatus Eisenbacteria bacterium]|uniref:VOC family protein n=1 Tax=Eiseniibacteriota bacterium TaxID=2212470 RepID=A0A538T0M0_UNCEI|nr:MAG: VOC family protein [Candidatus Eisenbacteria bacterium]
MAVVRYLVDDVDRAVEFYTKKLGFSLVERRGKPFAMVGFGDTTLWLSGPESSAARPMPDGRKPVPGGWNRLVVEVSDLESRVGVMKRDGVTFRNEIVSGPGGKQILIEDGCGNVVELFQPA